MMFSYVTCSSGIQDANKEGNYLRRRPASAQEPSVSYNEAISPLSKSVGRLNNPSSFRQNSNSISTDTSGAAIQTINKILEGITESVNRLTDLQYHIPTKKKSGKNLHECSDKSSGKLSSSKEVPQTPVVKIKHFRRRGRSLSSKQSSTLDSSSTNYHQEKKGGMSSRVNEKRSHREKIERINNTEMVDPVTAAPIKKKLKPYTKPYAEKHFVSYGNNRPIDLPNPRLVEIYHNNAAKESDSEEERNKAKIQVKIKTHEVPHLSMPSHDHGDCRIANCRIANCMHSQNYYEEPSAPRTYYPNKSYELPTISSKMKQAVKLDFNMFNFKAIPFCPVTSTTPSHNIGINIQQVMSIIKTRQPVQGISPTLAHNINLAAEKLNQDPITSFATTNTSKITNNYNRSSCPLNKYPINYRHLEEIAKTVPEETMEEEEDNTVGGGPSGDMQVRSPRPPTPNQWTNTDDQTNCTCASGEGPDINQVYNKYRTQPETYDQKSHNLRVPVHYSNSGRRSNGVVRKVRSSEYIVENNQQNQMFYRQQNPNASAPLQGKEKNLRDVLMNLHDDFESMNKRYEELSTEAANEEATQETLDELEELERQLTKKEEEINIVMTLYKEVLSLKEQINILKRRSIENSYFRQSKPEDYVSRTAQHISKLFNQTNHYSSSYSRPVPNGFSM